MPSSDAASISRRAFVRALGLAGAAAAAAPLVNAGVFRASARGPRTLVLIHLAGGHDGWNTFVPVDSDDYHRARPTLALRRSDLLRLDETLWLNRAASDLAPLFERGEFGVVPRVGFAPLSLSHYRATQIWLGGSAPDEVVTTPWFARGDAAVTELRGDFSAALVRVGAEAAARDRSEVFFVRLEGFDTHFDQRAAHDAAVAEFACGVAQLQRTLARRGVADRVLTVAFSEFGRTLAENEFGGTDHAPLGQCYFIGKTVRGGWRDPIDSLAAMPAVDHRRVIATGENWLGWPSRTGFAPLPRLT
ncbi:MAG: DUF1501 domain-containing protein [Candidatus Didemnitutus sp.]|nr:DUF1501 domain-containing protein [Candidatus Didemnitutus sp.]